MSNITPRVRSAKIFGALLVAWVTALCTGAAGAQETTLQFEPQGPSATGYRLDFALPGHDFYGASIGVSALSPDADGVVSVPVDSLAIEALFGVWPEGGRVDVAVVAYNGMGQSPRSNRVTVALPTPNDSSPEPSSFEIELISAGRFGDVWKYWDGIPGGSPHYMPADAEGDTWASLGFDDSWWNAGRGPLGWGELTGRGPTSYFDVGQPNAGCGPDAPCKITYLLRRTFDVGTRPAELRAMIMMSDGFILYINGAEAARVNLAEPVDAATTATRRVAGDEQGVYLEYILDASLLREGPNVVSVELHKSTAEISEVGFDMMLASSGVAPEVEPIAPPAPQLDAGRPLAVEDFGSQAGGELAEGWADTQPVNSLEGSVGYFVTRDFDGDTAFGTALPSPDVHSHLADGVAVEWSNYEVRGRMWISNLEAGVGVTAFSAYPDADAYYRLAYLGRDDFRIANHYAGQSFHECVGDSRSGVQPVADVWYLFRFQAFVFDGGTQLRAKVWAGDEYEPEDWQISCVMEGAGSYEGGRVGLWASAAGEKYWDDLQVLPLFDAASEVPSSVEPELEPLAGARQSFEDAEIGEEPAGWIDTARDHSLEEVESLFKVAEIGDADARERVFGTFSRGADIHSHYIDLDEENLYNYEFAGQMRVGLSSSGIGVTAYSDYPNSDAYYALQAAQGETFRLSSRSDGVEGACVGEVDSGVELQARTWYAFRIQAYDHSVGTRLRAKVWEADGAEPIDWQVDCVDEGFDALVGGLPGVWATGSGSKYWDDLELIPLRLE